LEHISQPETENTQRQYMLSWCCGTIS